VQVSAADGSIAADLTARHAVAVCTGSRAAIPPIPGLKELRPWTSREATSARQAPRRLAILGGGVVGCEMATAWRQLGSEHVAIIQRGPRLLSGFEAFAATALAEAFAHAGIRVLTNASTVRAERAADGTARLALASGDSIEADQILVATGREPRTDDLGLASIGLRDGTWLDVDDSLRVRGVSGGWLYAAGDVNHRVLLTHMGKYQARACGDAIAARAAGRREAADPAPWTAWAATADAAAAPQVIFTAPEIAAVGLTEQQARERGMRVRAVEYDLGQVAGAKLYADGYTGRAQIVVDEARRVIVGATFVGPDVGELLHAATIAVVAAVPLERLWHAVPSYPTMSEVWLRLLEAYGL